jgi:hypothetical protein
MHAFMKARLTVAVILLVSLLEKAEGANSFGSFGRSLLGTESLDVDAYVTKMVAEEEKRIRENPAAQTTALLQKVFGAAAKQ